MTDPREKLCFFAETGKRCSKFFLNRYFFLFIFCAACAVTALGQEVYGALIFVCLICLCLVLCDDIMAIVLPFLLMCVFLTKCYDSSATFIKYVWMIAPVAGAFLFHFIVYRQKFAAGRSFWGLLAVAVSVSMGGISWASGYEYFSTTALYYTFFLGIGMVVMYLLLKSQFSARRDYNLKKMLITILYIMGIFAAFMVLLNVIPKISFTEGFKLVTDFQPANNLSTFLTFALPCPFFFVPKSKLHLLSSVLMLASMILSGSRAGLVIGIVEFLICIVVSAAWDRQRRFFYVCMAVGTVAIMVILRSNIISVLKQANMYPIVKDGEVRLKLIDRAFDMLDPEKNPIFGHGLDIGEILICISLRRVLSAGIT